MTDLVRLCREATTATHGFYRRHHEALHNRGYAVLYGPPFAGSPLLTIGFQPGGRQISDKHLLLEPASEPWPPVSEYAHDTYPLARHLQDVFGKPLLRRSTGLNAIFFCSPNVGTFREEVPVALRREVVRFCLPWVERIVAAARPRLVYVIGLDTLKLFGGGGPVLVNAKGRVLATEGLISGARTIASLHLSGAQIATPDRQAITRLLRDAVGEPR